MAVNKAAIKTSLRTFIDKARENEDTEQAIEDFTEDLSTIIKDAILSATITAPVGSVQVTGTATNQSNVTPLTFEIS